MAVHKLLNDFYEHSYALIAIHSPLEDYRLAYFMNANLNLCLKREQDMFIDEENSQISVFQWDDEVSETCWTLLTNTGKIRVAGNQNNLFKNEESTYINYLIPEHKKVDYFLKIDDGDTFRNIQPTLKKIMEMQQIVTAYTIDPNQLKSKNNLIFLSNA